MTTAIVIAAGEATRWAGHLGITRKHHIVVDGERIIDRTVRLARQYADTVYVVARPGDDGYDVPGATRVDARLDPGNGDADKFLSSAHLWSRDGRTVVIYGDCWFTEDAMARIFGETRREWLLFCRFGPSAVTGATSGECWAQSFWPEHIERHEQNLRRIAGLWRDGRLRRCGGWEHARAQGGASDHELRRHRRYPCMVEVSDATEDFDRPKDWDRWIARRTRQDAVSVLVPYRPDGGCRDRAWEWVRRWWARQHPRWQIVEGACPDGPWVKALAVADALARADHDLLIVADADVVCGGVRAAVNAVWDGAPWAVPHGRVHRLSEEATAQVLAGADPVAALGGLARKPYTGVEGGGLVVLTRDAYRTSPLDPRFAGWGSEDESWALAMGCLLGKRWRGTEPLWHLWHEPMPRLNSHVGSAESRALHVRYQMASRNRASMRRLVAEHQPVPVGGGASTTRP